MPLQLDQVMLRKLDMQDGLQQDVFLADPHSGRAKRDHPANAYLSATSLPTLLRFRSEFSNAVWASIADLFRGQAFPDALDVDCSYGKAAIELARRGFRVTGIEPDVQRLARARLQASVEGVELQLLGADQEKQRLTAGSVNLVSVMHGFHLLHAATALPEMHRLLQPGGYLVAAWNDRDTTDPMVEDLEDLMEAFSPAYQRSQRLHDPEDWLPILTQGGYFDIHGFEQHSNALKLNQMSELAEFVGSMSFMQSALAAAPEKAKRFRQEIRALAARHFRSFDEMQVPLVSKLYVMSRRE